MSNRTTLVECTCGDGRDYADGSKPEWLNDKEKAINRVLWHKSNRTLYYGVHYKGQHVLVKIFNEKK